MKTSFPMTIALAVVALPVAAATPQQMIEQRQANFKQIGKAFKGVSDALKQSTPDVAVIKANASTLAALSTKLPTWFPRGTGKESGVKTEAAPAIWTKPAEFKAAAEKFAAAASGLRLASAGDPAQIAPAAGALGATCKGCHESFRVKE